MLDLIMAKLDDHGEQLAQISEQLASLERQAGALTPSSVLATSVSIPSDVVAVDNVVYVAMDAGDSVSAASATGSATGSENWSNDKWDQWAASIKIPMPPR